MFISKYAVHPCVEVERLPDVAQHLLKFSKSSLPICAQSLRIRHRYLPKIVIIRDEMLPNSGSDITVQCYLGVCYMSFTFREMAYFDL